MAGKVEITCVIVHQTVSAFAIKVEEDTFGQDAETIWLPKSQVEIIEPVEEGIDYLGKAELLVPEWLAVDKGLV